jgi:hypothetical protein
VTKNYPILKTENPSGARTISAENSLPFQEVDSIFIGFATHH